LTSNQKEGWKINDGPVETFEAYKSDPVLIKSFFHQISIISSKERPKKIVINGDNNTSYTFLLKCDKSGDLRKEARFIDFCQLINKMLESDG
jgi:phosphatidylinositol kinase/protein kinase (PI-3  family)